MQIIGFTGKMGSGKDTVGNMLVSNLTKAARLSFASKLKEVTKLAFNWTDDHVDGRLKNEVCPIWGVSPRFVLQKMGTEFFRDTIRKDYHIKNMDIRIIQLEDSGFEYAIITDVRFNDEAEYIIGKGGVIISVLRDKDKNALSKDNNSTHVSESGITPDCVDIMFDNNIPYKDIEIKVKYLANMIISGSIKEYVKFNSII